MENKNVILAMFALVALMLVGAMPAFAADTPNLIVHTYISGTEDPLIVDTLYVYNDENELVMAADPATSITYFTLTEEDGYYVVAEKNGYDDAQSTSMLVIPGGFAANVDLYLVASGGPIVDPSEDGLVLDKARFDDDVKPGEEVEFEITVENNATYDMEDVVISLDIEDFDIDEDLETDEFNLDSGDDKTKDFTVTVPLDAEDGEHTVTISVEWVDENDDWHFVEFTETLNVEKAKHSVEISEQYLASESVKPGESGELAIELVNVGANDETARVTIKNSELGISETLGPFEIEEGEKTLQYIPFEMPEDAENGKYILEIKVDYNSGKSSTLGMATLAIAEEQVEKSGVSITAMPITDNEEDSKASEGGKTTLVGGLVVLIIVLAISIALLARKALPSMTGEEEAKPTLIRRK